MQDVDEAIRAILTSNLIAQFKQANGEEPSAAELEEMISEMKAEGLYDEAAARISTLLGDADEDLGGALGGADEAGEESMEQGTRHNALPKATVQHGAAPVGWQK